MKIKRIKAKIENLIKSFKYMIKKSKAEQKDKEIENMRKTRDLKDGPGGTSEW